MMKSLITILTAIGASSAFAANLESVTVVDVVQEGDFMPPTVGIAGEGLKTTLTLRVATGGCTQASDFTISVRETRTKQKLTVNRVNMDLCEAYIPDGTEIQVVVEGLTLASRKKIEIANPVFVKEYITH